MMNIISLHQHPLGTTLCRHPQLLILSKLTNYSQVPASTLAILKDSNSQQIKGMEGETEGGRTCTAHEEEPLFT